MLSNGTTCSLSREKHQRTSGCLIFPARQLQVVSSDDIKFRAALIKEAKYENENFLLINHYNANTKYDQLSTLSDLSNLLEKIDGIANKSIVLGGHFNLFFETKPKAEGGSPVLKITSFAKIIQIKVKFDLRDVWKTKKPNTKRYKFCQQLSPGYIQRRLDFFLVSNNSQESLKKTDVLVAFSTDHTPVTFPLSTKSQGLRGKGLWKNNNS